MNSVSPVTAENCGRNIENLCLFGLSILAPVFDGASEHTGDIVSPVNSTAELSRDLIGLYANPESFATHRAYCEHSERPLTNVVIDDPKKFEKLYRSILRKNFSKTSQGQRVSHHDLFPRYFCVSLNHDHARSPHINKAPITSAQTFIPQSKLGEDLRFWAPQYEPNLEIGLMLDLNALNPDQVEQINSADTLGIIAIPTLHDIVDVKKTQKAVYHSKNPGFSQRVNLTLEVTTMDQIAFLDTHPAIAAQAIEHSAPPVPYAIAAE